MIYIAYIILLIILLRIESKLPTDNKVRWIIPLIYILFIGLRGASVGVDTATYYDHYYRFGEDGCDFVEIGFDWINRFCYHLGFSQAPFFIICAAIPILCVTIPAAKRLSMKEYTWFMLLFCTTTFSTFCNGMRQNIACGLFFALMIYLQDTTIKYWKSFVIFIIGILLASLFHVSVFFVIPFFFVRHLKVSPLIFTLLYLLSFIFVYYNVSMYFPAIELGERDYGRYLGGDLTNQKASSLGFIVVTIRNILLMLIVFLTKAYKRYPFLSNMTLMFFVMTNLGFNIPIISRFNMYFVFFYTLLIARTISDNKSNKNSITTLLALSLMAVIIVLTVYAVVSPANKLYPYCFYWDNSNYFKYL